MRVEVVTISYMSVHFEWTFNYWIKWSLQRPKVISPAPKVVLIINIIISFVDAMRWIREEKICRPKQRLIRWLDQSTKWLDWTRFS
jgi:hypothetical protein